MTMKDCAVLPTAVPSRTCFRSTSPVERWRKEKSLIIFLAMVPFPPPAGCGGDGVGVWVVGSERARAARA